MITISMLEDDDVIKADDWCRPLRLWGNDTGEVQPPNEYKGRTTNNVKWCKADIMMPIWVGRRVIEYHEAIKYIKYEFIRGNIPENHLYKRKQ